MAADPRPVGAAGKRLAANLRKLRQGMSTRQLSERLSAIGWPINLNSITRVEMGQRHTDIDDVVALAVVLDSSPNRLIMPELEVTPVGQTEPVPSPMPGRGHAGHVVPVVGDVLSTDALMWSWAAGDQPLVQFRAMPAGPGILPAGGADSFRPAGAETARFMLDNQPHLFPRGFSISPQMLEFYPRIAEVVQDALGEGLTPTQIRSYFSRVLVQVIAGGEWPE